MHAAGAIWVHRAPWGCTDVAYDARGHKVRRRRLLRSAYNSRAK